MNMKAMTDKLLKGLSDAAPEILDALKHSKGALGVLKAVSKAVPHIVEQVEKEGKEGGLSGADKKQLALNILNALPIPLPFWLAPFKGIILDAVIESAVAAYQRIWKK